MENFEEKMAELLEVESINDADELEGFEAWDSLTSLSIIAFIDENYKIAVTAKDLIDAKTIGGLKTLVTSRNTSSK